MGNLGDGTLDRDQVKAQVEACFTKANIPMTTVRCIDPMAIHQNMKFNMANVLFTSARERVAAGMQLSAANITLPGCQRTVWLNHNKTETEKKPAKMLGILYRRILNTASGSSYTTLEYDKVACQITLDDQPLAYVDLCGTGGVGSRIAYTEYAKEKFTQHELAHAKSVAEQKS